MHNSTDYAANVNTEGAEMHEKSPSAMIKPDEALALIGEGQISRRAFYNAIGRNEVPHRRLGRRILIPRNAFMQWLRGDFEGGIAREGQ
jgi:excisionase family DNA binding protein